MEKWDIPHYEHIAADFRQVSEPEREELKNMQQCKQILSNRLDITSV